MRVLICGIDGYLGWTLALHLSSRGHEVLGFDNFDRRKNVEEMGSWSATPILDMKARIEAAKLRHGYDIKFREGSMLDFDFLSRLMRDTAPNAVVHLAEQPSAPFSMMDRTHAYYTQQNNVLGTLNLLFALKEHAPKAHLVKLGTMGEYGTPNVPIPEGFFEIEYRGRKDRLPFPRQAGSFYHLSKVHDSANVAFACKIWGLSSTDIMQGVVYGTRTNDIDDDSLLTRFDFDEAFGTIINRYCAQAVIGYPLTPYGTGHQKRAFIALEDSMQCLTLAVENPPEKGEYRVFNQIDEVYGVYELAERVRKAGQAHRLDVSIQALEDPRIEAQEHFYEADHEQLRKLGFKPTRSLDEELDIMLNDLKRFRNRIEAKRAVIAPRITWGGGRVAEQPRALATHLLGSNDGRLSRESDAELQSVQNRLASWCGL
jgi:UDP-sulfoquinovose synthase